MMHISTYENLLLEPLDHIRRSQIWALETELYHLRNLGYVILKNQKARSIREIPGSGDELSDYIRVTEGGKKYIEIREKRA